MLEVRGLEVRYGRVQAVQGVSLEIREGEIVALVGPNGAGKSSTMHAISGIVRPSAGAIAFRGEPVTGLPSHEIVRRGIVQVPEGRMIFPEMTVRENLLLGAYARWDRRALAGELARVLGLFPVLRDRLEDRAAHLSGGQLQMLALARGVMGRPTLLLLDEPSLGLAPLVVREVFGLIGALRRLGVTILLVEQNVRQALALADRAYLLEGGRVVRSGDARQLLESDEVIRAYLGAAGG